MLKLAGIAGKLLGTVSVWRGWLTLIAVAAGWLYVQFAEVRSQRDGYAQWSELACASAGSAWVDLTAHPGAACRARIAALAKYRLDAATASASTLAKAMTDHDARTDRDTAKSRDAALASLDATRRMEAENARVQGNGVGAAWFDALNHAAGLQPSPG